MADWYVGQKVVCIAEFEPEDDVVDPVKGCVYTIRDIVVYDDELGFRFEEIVNPIFEYEDGVAETTFCFSKFRPVVSKDADISVFTTILDKINQRDLVTL